MFCEYLFGGVATQFQSSFSMQESIVRLEGILERSPVPALTEPCVIGTVTEEQVELQRLVPAFRSPWCPHFIGAFSTIDGRTVLKGWFIFTFTHRVVTTFWLSVISAATILAAGMVIVRATGDSWLPLLGIGLFACSSLMVRSGSWYSRNDVAWLAQRISDALTEGASVRDVMSRPGT